MKTSRQIFEYFPGIWKLNRRTSSKLKQWPGNSTGEAIRADGYAIFAFSELDKNVLIYSEKVTVYNLNFNDAASAQGMEARQKYEYKYDEQTSTLSKYFSDGRLFYEINFIGSEGESTGTVAGDTRTNKICGEHLCIQDNYVSDYKFASNRGRPVFTLTYSVNGPKKCYDIETEFERLEEKDVKRLGIQIENGEIVWIYY